VLVSLGLRAGIEWLNKLAEVSASPLKPSKIPGMVLLPGFDPPTLAGWFLGWLVSEQDPKNGLELLLEEQVGSRYS
jgi:hypothetical protein